LVIIHPFAPFVSETIWQNLGWKESILASKEYKKFVTSDSNQAEEFNQIKIIVSEVRSILINLKVSGVNLYFNDDKFLEDNAEVIKRLAGLSGVEKTESKGQGMYLINTTHSCWLDIDKSKIKAYVTELKAKQARQKDLVKQFEVRLSNKSYLEKAPKDLIEQTRLQLDEAKATLNGIEAEIQRFKD
jgi:valyl-tRNA synthetase